MNLPAWWKKLFQSSLEAELNVGQFTQQDLLKMAQEDLETAYALLRIADEQDLIDHAVYRIKAAEKKYDYLLRQAKEQSVILMDSTVSA